MQGLHIYIRLAPVQNYSEHCRYIKKSSVYWEHFGIFQVYQKRYILAAQCNTTPEHLEYFAVAA